MKPYNSAPLAGWIRRQYLNANEMARIRRSFRSSKPYPNFALPEFFNERKVSCLRTSIKREKFEKVDKDLFSLSHTRDLSLDTGAAIAGFGNLLSSPEFTEFMESITGERLSGRADIQSHLFAKGDYLLSHDDVVEGRSIAYILYLSDLDPADGGRLRLYDIKKPLKPVKSIIPKFNTFACFKVSNKSMHDVEEVKSAKKRLTIGGWFYGD